MLAEDDRELFAHNVICWNRNHVISATPSGSYRGDVTCAAPPPNVDGFIALLGTRRTARLKSRGVTTQRLKPGPGISWHESKEFIFVFIYS